MDDPPLAPARRGLRRLAILSLLYALVFTALAYPRTFPTFWSADNGFKWQQARILYEQGWARPWVTYLDRDIDPEGRFQPLGWKFGKLEPEGLRFTYPPAVAALFAPFAGTDSFRAGLILQALLAGACIFLVGRTARDLGVRRFKFLAVGLFGFSPWAAYVPELTEHIPALCLGLAAWTLLFPARAANQFRFDVVAGVLIGTAGLVRNEWVLWGAAVGVGLFLFSRRQSALGLWVGTVLLFSLGSGAQFLLSPDSTPLRAAEVHEDIPEATFGLHSLVYRWPILNHWLFGVGHYEEAAERNPLHPPFWAAAGILGASLLLRRTRLQQSVAGGWIKGWGVILGTFACGLWVWVIREGTPEASGLLVVFPLTTILLAAPIAKGEFSDRTLKTLIVALTVFAVLLLLGVGNSRGGRQWGPRYLMIAWPFLLILALRLIERASDPVGLRGWSVWGPLFLAGWLATGWALIESRRQQDSGWVKQLAVISREDPDRVFVTPHEYVPGAAAGANHRRWLLVPTDESQERELLKLLEMRADSWVWVGRRPPLESNWSAMENRGVHPYLIYAIKNTTQSF